MNKSLVYLTKRSLVNVFRKSIKKPLKSIGIILVTIYYLYLPFILKGFLTNFNLNSRAGFVFIASIGTLYLSMPMTLTYFKRKGVNFKQQDVNFILASPIPPKQALIYALSKDIFINVVMQAMFLIAAIFVFDIPLLISFIYIIINIIFSNFLSYSLAIIMYASEEITLKQKQMIKRAVYLILLTFTIFLLTMVISQSLKNGFDITYLLSTISSPFVLMIPIFGWQLGWLNLMILGATPLSLLATSLFFISTIYLTYVAYKMKSTGDYYEDALSFSENVALLQSKKGDVTIAEAFGKKQKKYSYEGTLKGLNSKVIFYKQVMERRRVKKYFLSFGDIIYLIAGIGLGVVSIIFDDFMDSSYFFEIMIGISVYLSVFFKPAAGWKSEFKNYYIFVMPDSSIKKLFHATLLEHFLSLIRVVFLTVPAGLLMRVSILEIFYAIIVQSLLKGMITYVSIFIEEIQGAKIGKTIASMINIFVTIILMIGPIIALAFITSISLFLSFITISLYALIVMTLFLYVASRQLNNIEALDR